MTTMPNVVLLPDGERGRKQLVDNLEEKRGYWKLKKGSTKLFSMENLLWKKLWTCRKTDYRMRDILLLLCVEMSENLKNVFDEKSSENDRQFIKYFTFNNNFNLVPQQQHCVLLV
jgi:hypothetical protein